MEKKEILEKARAEKYDEREALIAIRAMRWTYLVMILAAGIFTIVRSLNDQPVADLCATVTVSVGAGFLYRFIKTKDKQNLIFAILMLILGAVSAVRFFMGY